LIAIPVDQRLPGLARFGRWGQASATAENSRTARSEARQENTSRERSVVAVVVAVV
jgi:hypothetical protein